MKYKNILFLIVAALWFVACENQNEHNDRIFDPPSARTYMYINFVKFSNPEYLNYVVVEPDYFGEENMCNIRSKKGRTYEQFYIGSSPYIPLTDEYYIADWKWSDFIYPPTNFLIDVKWPEVKSRSQKWEYPSIYITSKFLKTCACIRYRTIDTYLQIEALNDEDYFVPKWMERSMNGPLISCPDSLLDYFTENVKHQDSLQNVYAERLIQIIKEDALEKCCVYIDKF